MFFINALKDYMDHLNDLSIVLNDNFTIFIFFKSFFSYAYNSITVFLTYIISFKWLTDFIELPASFKHNYTAILEGKNIFEKTIETELDKNIFTFFETSRLNFNSKNFFTGFFNSFFLVLPFSVPQLLTIRALLINGLPAGCSAALGTICGQFIFFSLILFGFEFIILPFLTFEPLSLLLGLILLINVLYKMIHNPNMAILNLSQKKQLLQLFGLNFILAWTEQTCIYNYFGNLTLNGTNLLQTSETNDNFILVNFIYLIGLFIGSLFFTGLFGYLIILSRNFITNTLLVKTPFIVVNERLNSGILLITTILCFTNIPYYGFDYLIYGPLGFISNDKSLQKILPKVTYSSFVANPKAGSILNIAVNPLSFDKYDQFKTKSTQNDFLKYEQYSLESETLWKNRYCLRNIQNSSTRKQIKGEKKNNFKQIQFEVPKYETPNLEFYSTKLQKKENTIETIFTQLFRDDVYLGYQDATSKRQLKQVQVHREFREKYYSNPVYKALMHLDIYPFLSGQPNTYNLTIEDESQLFKRRLILQNYLNSIQDYKKWIQNNKESYAEKIYNQQFKGSLSLIRHFNAVNLNFDYSKTSQIANLNLTNSNKVLKFDQPQYNSFSNEANIFLHEELNSLNSDFSKYMLLNNTAPLYVGWDATLRKFLIKTSYVPEKLNSGDQTNLTLSPLPSYFSFQSWSPAINNQLNQLNKSQLISVFKLPSLELSNEQLINLKKILQFETIKNSESSALVKKSTKKVISQQTSDALLIRLPNYDWYWKKSKLDSKSKQYLDLGGSLPPRLDGIAWPGIKEDLLMNKLLNE